MAIPLASHDRESWDEMLRRYVHDDCVDYAGFGSDARFGSFREELGQVVVDPAAPTSEQLAFLINGYNALVIASVLDGGSPTTLWGRYRFFLRTRHELAGEAITLWDLEHHRLRPLGEPRIHFAIVCASASCPALSSRAWSAESLERELEHATRAFVNDPTRNRFDLAEGRASLSAIFEWFEEDFAEAAGSVQRFLADYVDDPEVARALREERLRIETLDYDWSSNRCADDPA